MAELFLRAPDRLFDNPHPDPHQGRSRRSIEVSTQFPKRSHCQSSRAKSPSASSPNEPVRNDQRTSVELNGSKTATNALPNEPVWGFEAKRVNAPNEANVLEHRKSRENLADSRPAQKRRTKPPFRFVHSAKSRNHDAENGSAVVTDLLSHNTVLGYDSAGNQVTVKDANNNVTTTQYDALDRATFSYDSGGRRTGESRVFAVTKRSDS